MDYVTQFVEAVRFLEKFDSEQRELRLDYDQFKAGIKRNMADFELNTFLDENLQLYVQSFLENSLVDPVNHCHSFSQQFFEHWSKSPLGSLAPLAITIGNIEFDGKEVYKVSKSSVKKTMNGGFQPGRELDLHVWLTFNNMVVLDLTLIPTLTHKGLAKAADFADKCYVIWKDNSESRLKYIPILQDNQFMYKVDRVAYQL
ncbi:hypothetical protein K6Y31_21650 [Motilimonas cestriensis]|uniref:Uncharacterized protein n=1 Tax=Motilimonas cestriensis TaxID=2742685 RepID=A0ABS8WIB3_9GAMM|nr:hypothetical protein [Motilimonas cestriensis]MCE2597379.1 hypothetical protein [Motilimonas cestriensis]